MGIDTNLSTSVSLSTKLEDENSTSKAFWLPFTANRNFHKTPRFVQGAHGEYFIDDRGQQVYDSLSGLWTCGLGHGNPHIGNAINEQYKKLDYMPGFQYSHHAAFKLADKIVEKLPDPLNHVFFTNSGSESADTAIKLVRAYWRLKGQSSKTICIGREKGYHGVNIGGTTLGGINGNRKNFGTFFSADHLTHTLHPDNKFSQGLPENYGEDMANQLLKLIDLHDASNIAAVMIEPVSGSAGAIIPPVGYIKRIKEICEQNNILLIFDEVITAFGRLGTWSGAEYFGVVPDVMTFAKQITNGVIPMGGVVASSEIYNTFMDQKTPEHMIEFAHGYTYSAHPMACATALATLEVLEQENAIERSAELNKSFGNLIHGLKGTKHVVDIRNCGLIGAVQLASRDGDAAIRAFEVGYKLWDQGFYVRFGGDTLQFGPMFTTSETQLQRLFNAVSDQLNQLD